MSVQTTASIDSSQSEVTAQLFDGLGRVTESHTNVPEGGYITVQQFYDAMGRAFKKTNPYRPAATSPPETAVYTTSAYDALSRVKSLTAPDGSVVQTAFSGNQTLVTDQAGKQRMSQTDALGRLTDVWEITPSDSWTVAITFPSHPEASAGYHTTYYYDALDDLLTVLQGAQQRNFTYDSLKRLRSAQNPESGTIAYTYLNNGSLYQKTDGRPITTTYGYDALGRLISRGYSDSTPGVTMKYDGAGISPAVTNPQGRLTTTRSSVSETDILAYDVMGRAAKSQQVTGAQAYQMSYSYNLAGIMTDETYPSGKTVHTEIDSAGRIAGVKNAAAAGYYAGSMASDSANRVAYTSHGAVARMKLGNNLWEQTNYNLRLQPAEIALGPNGSASPGSTIDGSTLDLVYGYGGTTNNGNLLEQKISIAGSLLGDQTYQYDSLNRITGATETEQSGATAWTQTYKFDRYGNMAVVASPQIALTPLTPQSLDAFGTAPTNRIMTPNTVYDPAGNLTQDVELNIYSYDAENHMTACTVSGAASSYAYDPDGRRITKTTNVGTASAATIVFVYDGEGKLVAEYGGPASTSNAGTSYLTTDHLGSTRVVTNASGSVIARHDYLPFGAEIGAVGGRTVQGYGASDDTRQRFTSKERDSESGLDYFEARYFSSAQGRFTSPDEFKGGPHELWVVGGESENQALHYADITNPQSINKYQYCYNNPHRYIDPDGHDILVIENGPTQGNPVGHTAIAVTGYGVISFGNNTELGSSPSAYIQREEVRRETNIYIIKTTPEQDKAAVEESLKQDEKGQLQIYPDNCAKRANSALDAAGIPDAPGFTNPAGPTEYPADKSMPGTAGRRAEELPKDQVTKIEIPKGSTTVPDAIKQFEPKTPNPDPRLPKKENTNQQGGSSS